MKARRPATRLRVLRALPLLAALLLVPAQAQAPGDLRLALVIGNAAYPGPAALVNPANDARAMSESLSSMGFTIVTLQDASRAQMADAIAKVRETLRGKQAVGMLYYAGHGLQLDWRNYMVPVDAQLRQASDVAQQAVDLSSVIDAFKAAGNRLNIVVLDACRDNPFAGTASGKGLAPLDAPPGTFLAYATAPGNVAEDGDAKGGNGLYTQFLLQELAKPTAKIEDVFKRVRLQVRKQSQGRQIPWESTSLEDDFYFNTGQKPPPKPDESAKLALFNAQKAAWDRIKDSANPDDFFTFLQSYPQGDLAESAQFKLDRLAKPKIQAALGQGQDASLGWTGERYRLGDTYTTVLKDGLTGVVIEQVNSVVTAMRGDVVEINGGRMIVTPQSGIIRNNFGSFDPPYGGAPAEFQIGKAWEARSTQKANDGNSYQFRGSFKIVARETVTVPAGTFQTWVIDYQGFSSGGAAFRSRNWSDPRYGMAIKREETVRNRDGRIVRSEVREMVAIKADRS
ncbi:MAG: caspase family protein [Pseudomonadota bacterium]